MMESTKSTPSEQMKATKDPHLERMKSRVEELESLLEELESSEEMESLEEMESTKPSSLAIILANVVLEPVLFIVCAVLFMVCAPFLWLFGFLDKESSNEMESKTSPPLEGMESTRSPVLGEAKSTNPPSLAPTSHHLGDNHRHHPTMSPTTTQDRTPDGTPDGTSPTLAPHHYPIPPHTTTREATLGYNSIAPVSHHLRDQHYHPSPTSTSTPTPTPEETTEGAPGGTDGLNSITHKSTLMIQIKKSLHGFYGFVNNLLVTSIIVCVVLLNCILLFIKDTVLFIVGVVLLRSILLFFIEDPIIFMVCVFILRRLGFLSEESSKETESKKSPPLEEMDATNSTVLEETGATNPPSSAPTCHYHGDYHHHPTMSPTSMPLGTSDGTHEVNSTTYDPPHTTMAMDQKDEEARNSRGTLMMEVAGIKDVLHELYGSTKTLLLMCIILSIIKDAVPFMGGCVLFMGGCAIHFVGGILACFINNPVLFMACILTFWWCGFLIKESSKETESKKPPPLEVTESAISPISEEMPASTTPTRSSGTSIDQGTRKNSQSNILTEISDIKQLLLELFGVAKALPWVIMLFCTMKHPVLFLACILFWFGFLIEEMKSTKTSPIQNNESH